MPTPSSAQNARPASLDAVDLTLLAELERNGRLTNAALAERAGLGSADAAAAFKTIVYGGAPMYVADIERALAVMGPRFVQIYGQGETPMTATALARRHLADRAHPRHRERLASVGNDVEN